MSLTSFEVARIVWDWIKQSPLAAAVPTMYFDHFPQQSVGKGSVLKGEFIVITPLSNVVGDAQIASINVNVYVPDDTPRLNGIEQRYPDRNRLAELTKIAYEALRAYPLGSRMFFDVSSDNLFSEEDIPYSFSNIKVTLKSY